MKKFSLIILMLVSMFLISGCAKYVSGNYYSEVDPDYKINKDEALLVTAMDDDLTSKYYVKYVIEKLKNAGFSNVYGKDTFKIYEPKNTVVIVLKEKMDSYQYASADYGTINNGIGRIDCNSIGSNINCTTTNNTSYGVVGYSTKNDIVHGYYFLTHWFDESKSKRRFFVMGSTYEKQCDKDKLYKFMIEQTINRMNLEKPLDFQYKISTEQVDCK
ncbi:hypothetical protein E0765_01125 [Sulfuricurvum sp. IAE1]|uniref:hypothetical protein n=1 Tax=Sulfuricurvum sp. IAE1 TaxID=2546102 RepID=UPI00104FF33E|nr:hypothetical protein [Sulfuricurvum sp. IAE1]TDA69046.1 hypothetical protein E0765_01125 [Sulfuricurvum sp. IAE1]